MKILLSGSSGGFGSELLTHLRDFEADTISLRYGKLEPKLASKLSDCDVFIHCGGSLSSDFADSFNSNVLLTKELLDFFTLKNSNVHFIYFSTMSLLLKKQSIMSYDYANFRDMTCYALSKYISEIICSRYKINTTVVRFSTLFYKNPTRDGLSKIIYDGVRNKKITIYNNGEAKRDFLPLDVASQYVVKLIGKESLFGKTFNIVSGRETTFREIADFLKSKISDLTIKNENLDIADNVPTNFDCTDVRSIGEIDFRLFNKLEDYIQELKPLSAHPLNDTRKEFRC